MEASSASQARQTFSTVRDTGELVRGHGIGTSSDLAEDLGFQDAGNKLVHPSQNLHARKVSTSEKSKKQFGGIGLGGPSTGVSRPAGPGLSQLPQVQGNRESASASRAFAEEGSRKPMHRQSPSLSLSGRLPSTRRASIATHSPTSPTSGFSSSFGHRSRSSYNSKFKQIQSQTLSGRLLNYLSRHSPRQILLGLLFFGVTVFFLASLLGYGSSRPASPRSPVGHDIAGQGKTGYEELSGERYAQEAVYAAGGGDAGRGGGRGRPARIAKEPFKDERTYEDGVGVAVEFTEVAAKKLPPLAMRKQRLPPGERHANHERIGQDGADEVPIAAKGGGTAGRGDEADMFERNLALKRARQGVS
jgi:hypothetical protein